MELTFVFSKSHELRRRKMYNNIFFSDLSAFIFFMYDLESVCLTQWNMRLRKKTGWENSKTGKFFFL